MRRFHCKDVTEHADALIDGELGFADRLSLRAHLFVCVHCRRYIDQLRATIGAVRSRAWVDEPAASLEQAVALVAVKLRESERPPS